MSERLCIVGGGSAYMPGIAYALAAHRETFAGSTVVLQDIDADALELQRRLTGSILRSRGVDGVRVEATLARGTTTAISQSPHGVEPKRLSRIPFSYFRRSDCSSTISRLGGMVLRKPASESRWVKRITVRGRWWQSTIRTSRLASSAFREIYGWRSRVTAHSRSSSREASTTASGSCDRVPIVGRVEHSLLILRTL